MRAHAGGPHAAGGRAHGGGAAHAEAAGWRPEAPRPGRPPPAKQTIIECLKQACTGELPPNTKSGQSFIHDPKARRGARAPLLPLRGVARTGSKHGAQSARALRF
jgi:hypothetical protein